MAPDPSSEPPIHDVATALSLAKIEAKLDVAIAQHGAQLQDHERRLGTVEQENREQDARITANALTTAEVREQIRQVSDSSRSDRSALPVWVGLGVTILLAIISPILTVLLTR